MLLSYSLSGGQKLPGVVYYSSSFQTELEGYAYLFDNLISKWNYRISFQTN